MMKLKLLALGILLTVNQASAQVVESSLQNFVSRYGIPHDEKISLLEIDVNNDGKTDQLLTRNQFVNGRAGNIWTVYLQGEKGYRRLSNEITFRTDAYTLLKKADKSGLYAYYPRSGKSGSIVYFKQQGDSIRDELYRKIDFSVDEDKQIYEQMFSTPGSYPVQTIQANIVSDSSSNKSILDEKVSVKVITPGSNNVTDEVMGAVTATDDDKKNEFTVSVDNEISSDPLSVGDEDSEAKESASKNLTVGKTGLIYSILFVILFLIAVVIYYRIIKARKRKNN